MEPHDPARGTATAEPAGFDRYQTHVTIVAALHIAFSALAILAFAVALFTVVATGVWLVEAEGAAMGSTFAAIFLVILAALALPGLIGGIGLLTRQGWARPLLLIVAFVQLLNIPLGTAIGGYTIWVLTRPEVKAAL